MISFFDWVYPNTTSLRLCCYKYSRGDPPPEEKKLGSINKHTKLSNSVCSLYYINILCITA